MPDPHRDGIVRVQGPDLPAASGAVILVHGRGGSAADILTLVVKLDLPGAAYLAPEAVGRTWYPNSFLSPIGSNEPWLSSALAFLGRVAGRAEAAGLPKSRIALVGFSQGACLATEFVARNPARWGGLVAFTGGLIGPPGTRFSYPGDLVGTPVFLGAGDPDPHVPWQRVEETAAVLKSLGADVTLKRYPGLPHTIDEDEIAHTQRILARTMVSGSVTDPYCDKA